MSDKYFTLFVCDEENGIWYDEFGDHTRASCTQEIEWAHYNRKKKHLTIVNTGHSALGVINAGRKLNGEDLLLSLEQLAGMVAEDRI